jgi:hypothetical protein
MELDFATVASTLHVDHTRLELLFGNSFLGLALLDK